MQNQFLFVVRVFICGKLCIGCERNQKEGGMILYPIYRLVKDEVERVVEPRSGVYALIDPEGKVVYVGMSHTNLREELLKRLPEVEADPLIRKGAPQFFYFEHPSFVTEGYERQCILYHQFRPACNVEHPAKPFPYLKCPICLE